MKISKFAIRLSRVIQRYIRRRRLNAEHIWLHKSCYFDSAKFESNGYNKIHANTNIAGSKIGRGSFIGSYCQLPNCIIGRFCSLGHNIQIINNFHPSSVFVSTHPIFYSSLKQSGTSFVEENLFEEHKYCNSGYTVEIGNDVWIGTDVKIMGGITIGDGAIIAVGSVVTHSLPAYSIYGGVPAKLIRYRFTHVQIDYLMNFKWWDRPIEWLYENHMKFTDIEVFLNSK